MRILVVYQYYQDDRAPGHSLIYDWTQYLAKMGHEVTVIAGETGYMSATSPKKPWYKRLIQKEQVAAVAVYRCFSYSKMHRSYLSRLLNYLSFTLFSSITLLSLKKPQVLLASSPPIFPVFTAWLIAKLRRIPFVAEIRDLWPESAVQMGILKNKPLIAIMAWMEAKIYRDAKRIITLTHGIEEYIAERGYDRAKIKTIPCAVDTDKIYPDPEAGLSLRQQLGLQEKKILLYFGALGEANNIPVILRAAERLRERKDIVFLLVGDGKQRPKIAEAIADKGLEQVILHPPVAKDQARAFLNAADLGLATLLDIELFRGALPTKLFDYMAVAKPVLCGVAGEAEKLVQAANAGLCFKADNDTELAQSIEASLKDPKTLQQMGASGLQLVQQQYSAASMRKQIEQLLLEASS